MEEEEICLYPTTNEHIKMKSENRYFHVLFKINLNGNYCSPFSNTISVVCCVSERYTHHMQNDPEDTTHRTVRTECFHIAFL